MCYVSYSHISNLSDTIFVPTPDVGSGEPSEHSISTDFSDGSIVMDISTGGSSTKSKEKTQFYSLMDEVQQEYNQNVDGSTTMNDLRKQLSHEFDIYISMPIINYNENPIISWQQLKGKCPSLFKLAMKYCVAMGTSVPSERMFSITGRIMQTRCRLDPIRLSKLTVLNSINDQLLKNMLRTHDKNE